MNTDGRALEERDVERIERDIFNGLYNDHDIAKLFQTIAVQRKVLKEVLNLFKKEPLRLVSFADPIRNSQLAYYRELVSVEDA